MVEPFEWITWLKFTGIRFWLVELLYAYPRTRPLLYLNNFSSFFNKNTRTIIEVILVLQAYVCTLIVIVLVSYQFTRGWSLSTRKKMKLFLLMFMGNQKLQQRSSFLTTARILQYWEAASFLGHKQSHQFQNLFRFRYTDHNLVLCFYSYIVLFGG